MIDGVDDTDDADERISSRRRFLALGGGALATAVVAACSSDSASSARRAHTTTSTSSDPRPSTTSTSTPGETTSLAALAAADFEPLGTCRLVPEMTAGPFPLDRQLVRRDITEGAPGHPMRLGLRVVDAQCAPVPDAAVEIWHCDTTGDYSAFTDNGGGKDAGSGTTFLRGTQTAGADGIVEFQTVYPGWYHGRAVHIHVRVHAGGTTVATSQMFFDGAYTDTVYRAAPYARFGSPDTTNEQDGIAGNVTTNGTLLALRDAPTRTGPGTLALLNLGVRRNG